MSYFCYQTLSIWLILLLVKTPVPVEWSYYTTVKLRVLWLLCRREKYTIRYEKSKPQTAMVISLWFWDLLACTHALTIHQYPFKHLGEPWERHWESKGSCPTWCTTLWSWPRCSNTDCSIQIPVHELMRQPTILPSQITTKKISCSWKNRNS